MHLPLHDPTARPPPGSLALGAVTTNHESGDSMTTTTTPVEQLHAALDELTTDQRRDAVHVLLGYLWASVDPETRTQALDSALRIVR